MRWWVWVIVGILPGGFILFVAREWFLFWHQGPRPTYFPPEHPDSAAEWTKKMERARRLQAEEDARGD